jgi:hypothetical protein|eukprot:COSAG06_NODE_6_length_38168_cov_131.592398_32_plen_81_part_00
MTDKPVTEYYNHKYPTDEAVERTTVAMLRHVNELLLRVKTLETNAVGMKHELDSMGEFLCDPNPCKRRYKGVKGLDGDTE